MSKIKVLLTPLEKLEKRFFEKVIIKDVDGCWVWNGATNSKGYGEFWNSLREGKHTHSHQVSWILFMGDIPEGMQVLHRCDNPPCVNPSHLFLGTSHDNVEDRQSKGRFRQGRIYYGESHPQHGENSKFHKLTEKDVIEIRKLKQIGMTLRGIAKEFGVSHGVINNIIQGRKWAWLR